MELTSAESRRNFPKCCHVGLCNKYGEPEPPLDTADLIPPAAIKRQKATTVTFVNGSKSSMKVQMGRNDTVKVKMADAVCLEYVNTYTPLFDCRSNCEKLLSKDCRFMLSQVRPNSILMVQPAVLAFQNTSRVISARCTQTDVFAVPSPSAHFSRDM